MQGALVVQEMMVQAAAVAGEGGNAPQGPEETVEVVTLTSREQVHQRTFLYGFGNCKRSTLPWLPLGDREGRTPFQFLVPTSSGALV